MSIGTLLFTWAKGKLVGTDQQGNRYFIERKAVAGRRTRRWVLYKGVADASRVPS
ncbi:MAG TPA: NADH-ubiquinone oxidoreductase subunit NDUFA12 family protein, partial [Patescibacteria group bacterium]|nr:NADH-ubiquinone oxidoreductase subunit NDUFA12 family protein [Patescibacteria group bacterium]